MIHSYSLSVIMKTAHKFAKQLVGQYYKCLSKGLKKSWKMAKGELLLGEDGSPLKKASYEAFQQKKKMAEEQLIRLKNMVRQEAGIPYLQVST